MNQNHKRKRPGGRAGALMAAVATAAVALAAAACGASSNASPTTRAPAPPAPFLARLHTVSAVASTVPANGDVNPYGVAVVPSSEGRLRAGAVLVSNFNDKANVQGTGATIVEVSPNGPRQLFADVDRLPPGQSCPGGIGLSTALGILPGGWVVVGSLPTTTGGALPGLDPAGCLIVLNDLGTPVETITGRDIVGPWDMTLRAGRGKAELFVSNALGGDTKTDAGTPVSGNCTVVRIDLRLRPSAPPVVSSSTVIGKDYPWEANKARRSCWRRPASSSGAAARCTSTTR